MDGRRAPFSSYLDFAKSYIARCEEQHGLPAVERILDAAHALMEQGVFRYRRPPRLSSEKEREGSGSAWNMRNAHTMISGARCRGPGAKRPTRDDRRNAAERKKSLNLPEENLLYFLEKNSLVLEPWQREILRIVRVIAQYFYPQRQTKVMNEGCATFVHYTIMNTLYDQGRISEGAMLEILRSHTNVVFQPDFDDPRFSGINPYALGFAMMQDIQRICDGADGGGPRLVSRHCGQWRLARDTSGRLGELPRRIIHQAVSKPRPDSQMAALRAQRRRAGIAFRGCFDPQ